MSFNMTQDLPNTRRWSGWHAYLITPCRPWDSGAFGRKAAEAIVKMLNEIHPRHSFFLAHYNQL
eukprot:10989348-Karenia_brevis.AAC.1